MANDPRREAFESLAAQVYEPLQRYLMRRCPSHDIDEILNDTLTVLWRRIDEIPSPTPLPWCYGIARRCLANHRRGGTRRLRLIRTMEHYGHVPQAPMTSDREAALHTALGELNDVDREVVRLWAWEHLEPREIAEVLDVTPNAVSVRLSRITRRLRSELSRQDQPRSGHIPTRGHLELEP